MLTLKDFKGQAPAWCPGCGNFSILRAFNEAMVELELPPPKILIVSGIGQAGKFPHYTRCHTFNGLHGRTLPVATAIKIANHELNVFAIAGDGDCYGEGGNHLVHAIRRNPDIKLLVHDNQIYGLTKGQASPTSMKGFLTKAQPFGTLSEPFNPIAEAVALDCSFVARGFSGDVDHLKMLIKEAVKHRGFALIDILQPCVSFNKMNTYQWYREKVYRLDDSYNPEDRQAAFKKALEWEEHIPIGIIYKINKPTFEDQIPVLKEKPLIKQEFDLTKIESLLANFY